MATTLNTSELIRIIPQPKMFSSNMDVEEFIVEIRNYFDLIQIIPDQRNILIRAFMDEDTRRQFEKINDSDNYEERLRKLFSKSSNLAEDLQNALQYRKGNNSIEEYILQIEKNVEKVMRHKLTSTKLTAFLLKYCLDDKNMKEEVNRFEYTESLLKLKSGKEKNEENEDQRGPTPVKYIKEILKSVEERNRNADLAVLNKPSYAQVTKQKYNAHPYNQRNIQSKVNERGNYGRESRNQYEFNNVRQFQGRQTYSRSMNFDKKNVQCYGCQEFGHIRRNCPNLRCSMCQRRGHLSRNCFESRHNHQEKNDKNFGNYRPQNFADRRPFNRYDRVAALDDVCSQTADIQMNAENCQASTKGEMIGAIQME